MAQLIEAVATKAMRFMLPVADAVSFNSEPGAAAHRNVAR